MSYLRQAPPDEQTASTFEVIRAAYGFVPNFFRAQTMRPDFVDAEVSLMSTILNKQGALTRQQKEYLFLVCSAANMSTYCVTAHCEIVRILGIEGPEPEQVAIDHASAALPVTLKALLAFATKLTRQPTKIARQDIDDLRTHGFSDEQIMEAVVVVGFAKFSNFVAFGLGTVPDFDSAKIAFGQSEAGQSESVHASGLL
jgi:uncharacterized peroxidase-related enzyme